MATVETIEAETADDSSVGSEAEEMEEIAFNDVEPFPVDDRGLRVEELEKAQSENFESK